MIQQLVVRRPKEIQCWYFLYGRCKFGTRCVNSHTLPIAPPPPIIRREVSLRSDGSVDTQYEGDEELSSCDIARMKGYLDADIRALIEL